MSFDQNRGFGLAEVTTTKGEKYAVYIPLNNQGFKDLLPFFQREEDIEKGIPQGVDVDNVHSVYATTTGLYLEQMVIKGRSQHVLGARVLAGAVELFSYTQLPLMPGPAGFQSTPGGFVRQQWYLRQQGELVEISRNGFAKNMAAYFQDDPVLVEMLLGRKMGFNDLKMIVRLYNEHKATATK